MVNQISSVSGSTVPGLNFPTQKGMISGNPRDSAIAAQTNINVKQANLGNAVGGKNKKKETNKKRMKKRNKSKSGGATDSNQIVVPQFNMSYQPTGGPGQTPNSVIQQNAQTSTQTAANAVYDNYATIKGGNKYTWGCYSGGKIGKNNAKRKSIKSIKSKKYRKTRIGSYTRKNKK